MESVPVGHLFPMASQEAIHAFMDNSDGKYEARRNGFYEYLFLIRTEAPKTFADAFLTQLFTKEYQHSHHWPSIL